MKKIDAEKMKEFNNVFNDIYNVLYEYYEDEVYASRYYDAAIHIVDDNLQREADRDEEIAVAITSFNIYRQDIIGSDREAAAFGITYATMSEDTGKYYNIIQWWNAFNEYIKKGIIGKIQ